MLLHFSQLKKDLPGQIGRIAGFLDIEIDAASWPAVLDHCGFAHMKSHADLVAPRGGVFFEGGAQSFINKGTNARWRDVLGVEDIREYETAARNNLGEDCATWLATGQMPQS
jgi:aryl sulfotransferase